MRKSGILMHLTSLPSPYGIGTMGEEARRFADFLAQAGQSVWQMLPIGPTSYGDSPYQSFSTFAGNPYLIDLDDLAADGLLQIEEYRTIDWGGAPDRVDYGTLYEKRYGVLRLAALRLLADAPSEYETFCRENDFWLPDYALFMALKDAHGGRPFQEWDAPLRRREADAVELARQEHAGTIAVWQAIQFLFFRQWYALKAYANERGIAILGDLPIYVSPDGADLWAQPDLFQLDETGHPSKVAGCPPDGFSPNGQLWGNPLYNWERMAQDDYAWWVRRIGAMCRMFDILRIDHFRGFDAYYAIPYGAGDAKNGAWEQGPGMALFNAVERALGRQTIVAEDLGFLTDSVRELLCRSGFPGMKVLQFAFDSRDCGGNTYLPHCYTPHCVAYTGTHDNDTIRGWAATAAAEDVDCARAYLHLTEEEGLHWGMMRGLWSSVADLTVVQAQDLLGLGSEARMNTPSVPSGNWRWRALPGSFDSALAQKLHRFMQLYGRLPSSR